MFSPSGNSATEGFTFAWNTHSCTGASNCLIGQGSCLPRAFSPLFFAVSLVPFLLSPCSKELELYGYKRMLRRNLSHTFSLSLSRQEEKSAPLHRKIISQLTRCTQKHDNYRAHPSPDGLDGRRVDANKQRTHCMSVRRLLAGTLGTERVRPFFSLYFSF